MSLLPLPCLSSVLQLKAPYHKSCRVWNCFLWEAQSGFWRNQGTNDQLEIYICNGLIKNHHVVSIFFDLKKAYDTTWKYGILKDLHKTGIKGNVTAFIKNFLSCRTFTVWHGNKSSDIYKQETGIPQGSILSVALFILKINSIKESIHTGIKKFLYVDDFAITHSSPNMSTLERQMQNWLNKIKKWKWLPILKNKNFLHTFLQDKHIPSTQK